MCLQNMIALIPGASRPIGRSIAKLFGGKGASLILPVFDWPESIIEMNNEFNDSGFNYHSIPADLRKEEDVLSVVDFIKDRYGHLNFLINNIERGGMPVVHGKYDLPQNKGQWELEIETTLKAKWLLFQHCLPLLVQRKSASVVNISSIASETGRSGPGACFFNDAYSAANRAIQSFTHTWAREAAPSVRVNELCLGLIKSRHGENTRGWTALQEEEKEAILDQVLLQRTGSPEEVAQTVFFLAFSASYMTGAVIKMDGGFSLGSTKVPPFPPGIL